MTSKKNQSQRSHIKNGHSKKRRYYTLKQRRAYYEQWQSSEQSKAQFCRTHQIPRSNFYKWVSAFKSEEPPSSTASKDFTFRPIKATARTQPIFSTMELHLKSGHYFRLPSSIEGAQLKVLMEIIE